MLQWYKQVQWVIYRQLQKPNWCWIFVHMGPLVRVKLILWNNISAKITFLTCRLPQNLFWNNWDKDVDLNYSDNMPFQLHAATTRCNWCIFSLNETICTQILTYSICNKQASSDNIVHQPLIPKLSHTYTPHIYHSYKNITRIHLCRFFRHLVHLVFQGSRFMA